MSGVDWAREELRRMFGNADGDPAFTQAVLAIVAVFHSYPHDGGTDGLMADVVRRLVAGQTLTPLTSDPDEWQRRATPAGTDHWVSRRDPRAISVDGGQTWWFQIGRRPGERCYEDGALGTLHACEVCNGEGVVHVPDPGPGQAPVTAAGTVLTDDLVAELAAEAERGYPLDRLVARPLADRPAAVITAVRLPNRDLWRAVEGGWATAGPVAAPMFGELDDLATARGALTVVEVNGLRLVTPMPYKEWRRRELAREPVLTGELETVDSEEQHNE